MVLSLSACYTISNYDKPVSSKGPNKIPRGMPTKPGACYAKCTMPDIYNVTQEQLFLFTGDPEYTNVDIETIEVVVSEGGKEWVKKKADKNCLSANVDTSTTKEYESFLREDKVLVSKGGNTEWLEVVCQGKMSKTMVIDVQKYLTAGKYYFGDIDGEMDSGLMEALVNFQDKNELAKGQLTFESLDVMGVNY